VEKFLKLIKLVIELIFQYRKYIKVLKGIVVVESPAKAKTLEGFLGRDYKVVASYGHVRDLVSKDGSVDPNNHYEMRWEFNEKGKRQVKEISDSLKLAGDLFLATDPDREGEAISWHILESLKQKKVLSNKNISRVVFHEITESAVKRSFENPKQLNQSLVEAYLARRVLDYLVGFSLSPILWRKMPGARSAGRVQSVALRLIVERELEIQKFNSEEYWSIYANFRTHDEFFTANLTHICGEQLGKLDIKNESTANKIKSNVEAKKYFVEKVEKRSAKRSPYAPFTTSTMQQESVRKLGFSAKKTMQIAQKLYEGVPINGTMSGLITYMRTDSTTLSNEAIEEARAFIKQNFSEKYLPKSPKTYKTKTKNAQEAHEAIRPTSFMRTPNSIKNYLQADEFSLYELIWKRAMASQIENAVIEQVSADISSEDSEALFRASGSTVAFDGFLKVYAEATDDDSEDKKNKKLPILSEGEKLSLADVTTNQHFTQPPPRFNEASLVKKLEELGIGRPSTYATIINVLQERRYVSLQRKVFMPESIGFLVISFLRNFFSKYIEYDFTAGLEEELDDISNGKLIWEEVLDKFWQKFCSCIDKAKELTITKVIDVVEQDISDYIFKNFEGKRECPLCKTGRINLKLGKYGAFLGCSNYPECKFTKKLGAGSETQDEGASQLKTEVGKDRNGDVIFLKKGPFGYYCEWQNTKDERNKKKPKRMPIPKFVTEPSELTIDEILALNTLPIVLGAHPTNGKEIHLVLGKFGPYIRCGKESYKLEKNINFIKLSLKQAVSVIEGTA
jgi:DNA topoisomerase-1